MNEELTLNGILQIENSGEILEPCCPDTGIPIWSSLRDPFHRMILEDLLYGAPMGGGAGTSLLKSSLGRVATITRAFAHNFVQLRAIEQEYPVLMMASGARVAKSDGLYFNNLSDHFVAASANNTFAIEDLFGWKWPFPRHHNNLILHTPLRVEGVLKGRLRAGAYRKPARELVDLVSQRAKSILGWEMGEFRRDWLASVCANGAASYLPRYQRYQTVLRKTGARLLIKEEACYGGADNASAVLAARDLGIATAEYQHGAISSGHIAYNFASAVSNSVSYRRTLPDHFLAYGSWWVEQINVPINKVVIGNPHREETQGNLEVKSEKKQILVLGDGIDTSNYLEFCEQLASLLSGVAEVVFRPHPLERARVASKYSDRFSGKVRLDLNQDMYSSFQSSEAVVSEVSTGLFEAIGFVPKVFIWDTPKARFSYPVHPFQGFADAAELARMVVDENAGRVSEQQTQSIWAPNWKQNYLDFIAKVVQK